MLKITYLFIFISVICSGCAIKSAPYTNASCNAQQIQPSCLNQNSNNCSGCATNTATYSKVPCNAQQIQPSCLNQNSNNCSGCATCSDCAPKTAIYANEPCQANAPCNGQQIQPSGFKQNSNYYFTVTRPGCCNDFPVTYRIQIPDQEDRVRSIDRPLLVQPSF